MYKFFPWLFMPITSNEKEKRTKQNPDSDSDRFFWFCPPRRKVVAVSSRGDSSSMDAVVRDHKDQDHTILHSVHDQHAFELLSSCLKETLLKVEKMRSLIFREK